MTLHTFFQVLFAVLMSSCLGVVGREPRVALRLDGDADAVKSGQPDGDLSERAAFGRDGDRQALSSGTVRVAGSHFGEVMDGAEEWTVGFECRGGRKSVVALRVTAADGSVSVVLFQRAKGLTSEVDLLRDGGLLEPGVCNVSLGRWHEVLLVRHSMGLALFIDGREVGGWLLPAAGRIVSVQVEAAGGKCAGVVRRLAVWDEAFSFDEIVREVGGE